MKYLKCERKKLIDGNLTIIVLMFANEIKPFVWCGFVFMLISACSL